MNGYLHGGWKLKYIIAKTSGRPIDPKADYFVLRLDKDPHALNAILRYAYSIRGDNPELALDLFAKAEEHMAGLTDVDTLVMQNTKLKKDLDKYRHLFVTEQLKNKM